MSVTDHPDRVLSGMRPTGRLHLGHYHGVLKNWAQLQNEYECFFFVADWHALTTHYEEDATQLGDHVWEMVVDWLAAGIDPERATLFIQSNVPQHAELQLLLSMITPLGWLERVPSYKEQQAMLHDRELDTHGFLGYPLLQSADILVYRAERVPVGEDQVPHIELTREIARRFNHVFGCDPDFTEKAAGAVRKLGARKARLFEKMRRAYTEQGDHKEVEKARALIAEQRNLTRGDKERLYGYLEGAGRMILPEPYALLTEAPRVSGLDGRKMSKSYDNIIAMRDDPERVTKKLRAMPTDPARARRNDPGDPNKCPVWNLHKLYSSEEVRAWAEDGCRSAGIGCLDCKKPLIDEILKEQQGFRERALPYTEDRTQLRNIIADGCEKARDAAEQTMEVVRDNVGTDYF